MAERILIVDDEEASRELCRDFLEADGYTLQVAEGGEAALRLLEPSPCPLVITDLNMPQMNGLELLRVIKQRYPDTEVILITAYGEIKTAVEAMRDGAFDYITKP
ncbi:MAG: response regulator, partial [Elusimicrobia bacterium]|nr:response regulator [Elusimicrobiota bacterium]